LLSAIRAVGSSKACAVAAMRSGGSRAVTARATCACFGSVARGEMTGSRSSVSQMSRYRARPDASILLPGARRGRNVRGRGHGPPGGTGGVGARPFGAIGTPTFCCDGGLG
jgi:hypothetical protein